MEHTTKKLSDMQTELDQLSKSVASSSNEARRAEAHDRVEALRTRWSEAKAHLDEAEVGMDSAWDDVKAGFRKSYDDLKESIARTRQWMSDAIAP